MKLPFFLLAIFFYCEASTTTQSKRSSPDKQQNLRHLATPEEVPRRTFASVDMAAVEVEDEHRQSVGLPPRFAIANHDLITPETDGIWESTPEGLDMWRLRVEAPNAKSLNFGFTKYNMPEGGQLSIYSSLDKANSIRPFTSADNKSHGELWTPPLPADTVIIEVTVPSSSKEALQLELTSVNVGYRTFHDASSKHRSLSGSCNVDVACWQGNAWQKEIASAGVYSLYGEMWCSGGLINRVDDNFQENNDLPLFLTAYHCEITSYNAPSVVVFWNYETSTCGGTPDGSLSDFQTGATLLAQYEPTDFALLQLDSVPNAAWNVIPAGWNRLGNAPSSAVAIHHPNLDEKSISFEYDSCSITSYLGSSSPGDQTHICVHDWDVGTTEGGSSGSPLFDQNHCVVGQLHGGYAGCGNNEPDWYGRISASWTGGGTPATRLSDWLDPYGNGALTSCPTVPLQTHPQDEIFFSPTNLEAEPLGDGRFRVVEGSNAMMVFDNLSDANLAIDIIQYYGMDSMAFVGRPDPDYWFFLVDGEAPGGSYPGTEDCLWHDRQNLVIEFGENDWYYIRDDHHNMFTFPNRDEAEEALQYLIHFRFDYTCYVGRDSHAGMYYSRREESTSTCPCLNGDNGGECGICLRAVESYECPSNPDLSTGCTTGQVAIGQLCEASGNECGTNPHLNNCGSGHDVYQRIYCDGTQPQPQGSCAGHCYDQAPEGCWCDSACDWNGDCCPDVCDDCPSLSHCF